MKAIPGIVVWRRIGLLLWLILLSVFVEKSEVPNAALATAATALVVLVVGAMEGIIAKKFPRISLDWLAISAFVVLAFLSLRMVVAEVMQSSFLFFAILFAPLYAFGLVVLSGILALGVELVAQTVAGQIKREVASSQRWYLVLESVVVVICLNWMYLLWFP